jgi:hypothetical protein
MRKILMLAILFSVFFVVSEIDTMAATTTITGISKIYIEFENGENQVLEINPSIDYSYNFNDGTFLTENSEEKTLLLSGSLNTNSKIKHIGLYCSSVGGVGNTIPINGYLGVSPSLSTDNPFDWITSYSTPISWFFGTLIQNRQSGRFIDISSATAGVTDFNQDISITETETLRTFILSPQSGIDAVNKKVKIRFKAAGAILFVGSENQAQDL